GPCSAQGRPLGRLGLPWPTFSCCAADAITPRGGLGNRAGQLPTTAPKDRVPAYGTRQTPERLPAGMLEAMPDAREDHPMRAIPMDIHPGCLLRSDHDRPPTRHVGRHVASLVMFAMLATPLLVYAQTVPSPAGCSDRATQGLSNVGAWAEAQCA